MVSVGAQWATDIQDYMKSVCSSKKDTDVSIWVGSQQITAHKFMLNANSVLLNVEDSTFNENSKYLEVYLDDEFAEHFQLVQVIISSFYSGVIGIDITLENVKLIYKFATVYSVRWLAHKIILKFKKFLNERTFIDLLKFSHSMSSSELKTICLEYMNPDIAEMIINTNDSEGLDYYCMKSLVTITDCIKIREIQKFQLLTQWYEQEANSRSCHIEDLLSGLQYHLIAAADLFTTVNAWIMDSVTLQDDQKLRIAKRVSDSAKMPVVANPIPAKTNTQSITTRPFMLIRNVDKIIENVYHIVQNKTAFKGCHPTNDDVIAAVYYKWKDSDELKRHMMIQYIAERSSVLLCKERITDIVLLYDNTDFSLRRLISIKLDEIKELAIHVDFSVISYYTLEALLLDMIPIVGNVLKTKHIFILEMLMNWALQHLDGADKIKMILCKVCTCALPLEYMKDILIPYLEHLCLYDSDHDNICDVHNISVLVKGNRPGCYTGCLTPKMYMLQDDDVLYLDLDNHAPMFRLNLRVSKPYPLFMDCPDGGSKYVSIKFILYNKGAIMYRYPPHRHHEFSLNELRGVLARYHDLHVMYFKTLY